MCYLPSERIGTTVRPQSAPIGPWAILAGLENSPINTGRGNKILYLHVSPPEGLFQAIYSRTSV